jgi:hypothetical protein
MTELTAIKVRLVMLAIAERRLRGEIPESHTVSTAQCETISRELGLPVSEATFRRDERLIAAKARLALTALRPQ